jgi:hypothetical protein
MDGYVKQSISCNNGMLLQEVAAAVGFIVFCVSVGVYGQRCNLNGTPGTCAYGK